MSRPRKYADTIVKSFCVERPVYEALRTILTGQGRSLSEEVNELLKRRLAELKSIKQPSDEAMDYEALKRGHVRLTEETIRLKRLLEKIEAYDALLEAAEDLGLNLKTFDNTEEVAVKNAANMGRLKSSHTHIHNPPRNSPKNKTNRTKT